MSAARPIATCPNDDEPLVLTFEFPGYEFICMVCGNKYEFLAPKTALATPELIARCEELGVLYLTEFEARRKSQP